MQFGEKNFAKDIPKQNTDRFNWLFISENHAHLEHRDLEQTGIRCNFNSEPCPKNSFCTYNGVCACNNFFTGDRCEIDLKLTSEQALGVSILSEKMTETALATTIVLFILGCLILSTLVRIYRLNFILR